MLHNYFPPVEDDMKAFDSDKLLREAAGGYCESVWENQFHFEL